MSHVMCYMSGHVSCVTCHMSHVTCHVSHDTIIFSSSLDKVVNLIGGGPVINGAYHVQFFGIFLLVSACMQHKYSL